MKAHPAHYVLPMDRVKDVFEAQVDGVKQACADQQNELKKELR